MFSPQTRREATRVGKKLLVRGGIAALAFGLLAVLAFVGIGLLAVKISGDNNAAKQEQQQTAGPTADADPVPSAPEETQTPSEDPSEDDDDGLTTTVVRVIDGDTIVVAPTSQLPANGSNPDEHIVRILGIDTPEMNYRSSRDAECGADEATRGMQVLVRPGREVTLTYDERSDRTDRYGRTLAYVGTTDYPDVGLEMVKRGYAEPYYPKSEPEPERVPVYENAYKTAKAESKGPLAYCD